MPVQEQAKAKAQDMEGSRGSVSKAQGAPLLLPENTEYKGDRTTPVTMRVQAADLPKDTIPSSSPS